MQITAEVHLIQQDRRDALRAMASQRQLAPFIALVFTLLFWMVFFLVVLWQAATNTLPFAVMWAYLYKTPVFWMLLVFTCILILTVGFAGSCRFANPNKAFPMVPGGQMVWLVTPGGLAGYRHGQRWRCYARHTITKVTYNKTILLALHQNHVVAILPAHCFKDANHMQQAAQMLQNTAFAGRNSVPPALYTQPAHCLWAFGFLLQKQHVKPQKANLAKAFSTYPANVFGVCAAISLAFTLACFAIVPLPIIALYSGVLLTSGFLATFLVYPVLMVWHKAAYAPAFLFGACTLEISENGLRFYNQNAEACYQWEDITRIQNRKDISYLYNGDILAAILPHNVAPPPAAKNALAYIQEKIYTQ